MLRGIVLNKFLDPLKITGGEAYTESEYNVFADDFDLPTLYYILYRYGMVICIIAIVIILLGMYFVNKTKLGEKKEQLMHVLTVMFVMASLVGILNILHNAFSGIF